MEVTSTTKGYWLWLLDSVFCSLRNDSNDVPWWGMGCVCEGERETEKERQPDTWGYIIILL